MAVSILRSLARSTPFPLRSATRSFCIVTTDVVTSHTDTWMQCASLRLQLLCSKDKSKKSPMELINEVPPIKVDGRIVACEGAHNPSLGHPIEFICLDLNAPAICKYCGLRYVQNHGAHH